MFFIILLREMERPLFLSWTNYPFPSGRCSCIQYCECVSSVHVCVFQSHCVLEGGRGWIQGFPVEIIIDHNMHRGPVIKAGPFYQKYCHLQEVNQANEFILFRIKDWNWRQIYVRIARGRTFIYHLCKLISLFCLPGLEWQKARPF